jgi:hypothetical protein
MRRVPALNLGNKSLFFLVSINMITDERSG